MNNSFNVKIKTAATHFIAAVFCVLPDLPQRPWETVTVDLAEDRDQPKSEASSLYSKVTDRSP